MIPQKNPDVDFINHVFGTEGRKTIDKFRLNRLDKAITALENNNLIQGKTARATFLSYQNQHEQALALLQGLMKSYNSFVFSAFYNIVTVAGDFDKIRDTWQLYQKMTNDFDNNTLQILLDDCVHYLDIELLQENNRQQATADLLEFINDRLEKLDDFDISIDNYRKMIALVYQIIQKDFLIFSLGYDFHCVEDGIVLIFHYDGWQDDDLAQLFDDVNQAILAVDDVDFQLEMDNVVILFSRDKVEKLPEDFQIDSLYFDSDEPLIQQIYQRMQNHDNDMIKLDLVGG